MSPYFDLIMNFMEALVKDNKPNQFDRLIMACIIALITYNSAELVRFDASKITCYANITNGTVTNIKQVPDNVAYCCKNYVSRLPQHMLSPLLCFYLGYGFVFWQFAIVYRVRQYFLRDVQMIKREIKLWNGETFTALPHKNDPEKGMRKYPWKVPQVAERVWTWIAFAVVLCLMELTYPACYITMVYKVFAETDATKSMCKTCSTLVETEFNVPIQSIQSVACRDLPFGPTFFYSMLIFVTPLFFIYLARLYHRGIMNIPGPEVKDAIHWLCIGHSDMEWKMKVVKAANYYVKPDETVTQHNLDNAETQPLLVNS
eukprot:m.347403 g.347403  ORF g.347403 m.347403 type:complete len:316 (-) comp32616_c0_seq1:183-1130(-)